MKQRRIWVATVFTIVLVHLLIGCDGGADGPTGDLPEATDIEGTPNTVPEGITSEREIELDLSDVMGVDWMRFAERPADLETVDWSPFASRLPWVLTPGDGSKTIDGQLRNESGVTIRVELIIQLAEHPPRGHFLINGGSLYTDETRVEIDARQITGADFMRLSTTADGLSSTAWTQFVPRTMFEIGSEHGLHTIHGEFKDELDRVFQASASITLMDSVPSGSFDIDGGATHTNHPERLVILDFSRIRNATEVRLTNENEDLESAEYTELLETMEWTLSPGEGFKEVWAEFRSPLGPTNVSSSHIIYDVTPPPSPAIMAPERTGNRAPTWVWSSEGASQYVFRFDTDEEWEDTTDTAFVPGEPLTECNRDYSLAVMAGDEAGNWSEESIASVFVYCLVAGVVSLHDPQGGDLYITLLNEQEYEEDEIAADMDRMAVVHASEARFQFEDVPNGEWILLGFQDNDGNEELSFGLFGAPTEPWGTYAVESWASLVDFSEGHFVIDGDGRSDIELRLSGFHW